MSHDGKVNIRGREYLTVALRTTQFREDCPIEKGWSIQTEILSNEGNTVIVRASVISPENLIVATGHAEERRDASQINRTSALENCETSAIGRALAAAGYVGSEFASANEVQNAIHQQHQPVVQPPPEQPAEPDFSPEEIEEMKADLLEMAETMGPQDIRFHSQTWVKRRQALKEHVGRDKKFVAKMRAVMRKREESGPAPNGPTGISDAGPSADTSAEEVPY